MRSRFMLGLAAELVSDDDWPHNQIRVQLRRQGSAEWAAALFASDGADGVAAVLDGSSDLAILNPATAIRSVASRLPGGSASLASICTIPSYDQLGFAVRRDLGVETLEELVALRPPLRLSLRGSRPNHSVHRVVDDVLAAAGTSREEISGWGGELRYDDGHGHGPVRSQALRAGEIDALFDEGIYNWIELAHDAGFRPLSLGDATLERLVGMGYRAGVLRRARYPFLDHDVVTADFSGFVVVVRADAADERVEAICRAILAGRDDIPWQGGPALPLDRMVADTLDAPIPLPFHPAAARVWREAGLPVATV